jgi:hypothetical protein
MVVAAVIRVPRYISIGMDRKGKENTLQDEPSSFEYTEESSGKSDSKDREDGQSLACALSCRKDTTSIYCFKTT